ncbi:hypothetical protein BS47DRAFT_1373652 [Hydnum rufescens UP504]|uniref:CxC2-like cysteine cluster KDZ transposase-associated domain-containing protein n=1 Tax=Hydnum rufescens UP504 TaxID=1448309 RepID=A0A9P6ANK6_9AGAM|nr:hypothetical protein BS47DRAFT_1373652 [Hydnum rufescens UP504]
MLWCEGRGYSLKVSGCIACKRPGISGTLRCKDCFGDWLLCQQCCVERHTLLPFHRIQSWNGQFFSPMSLHALGAYVQVGHCDNTCIRPCQGSTPFTIIHTNGIHTVDIQFCDCSESSDSYSQLLCSGLFPATIHRPQTCATFQVLHHFHILTLQSKITPYNFYAALERKTNNTGISIPVSKYRSFLRMVREWKHLKLLKCAGHGNDPTGVTGTSPGGLAVVCPACPHPNINLPEHWDDAPPELKFLYMLFLAIDANFRMKGRWIKGEDQGLSTGWAYFCGFAWYCNLDILNAQVSTCSGLSAIDHANSKASKGLHATGVGASTCARHGFILPNGFGDLQKGERKANLNNLYCNMDFIVFLKVDGVIPKFHLPAHKEGCHTIYSLNLRPGAGRTDGEGIERDWSAMNAAATSTKEMGEGSRHDALDDFWGDWNYRKILGIGPLLQTKLRQAILEMNNQCEQFWTFTSGLPPESVTQWEAMIEIWNHDRTKPNPYEFSVSSTYVLFMGSGSSLV